MMRFEFSEQVFPSANRVTIVAVRGKKFVLAFGASSHRGNFAYVSQDGEITLWHSAGSLTQIQALHHKGTDRLPFGKPLGPALNNKKPTDCICGLGVLSPGSGRP